jgi:hypothetical protein
VPAFPSSMLLRTISAVALIVTPFVLSAQSGARATTAAAAEWRVPADAYYPDAGPAWARRAPAAVGLDSSALAAAIAFAIQSEANTPRDLELAHVQSFGREPFGDPIGPFTTRGDPTGIILRNGYVVATWGDPSRVDMTFSVTKSFLSTTVVGVAVDRGMIRDVHDRVAEYVGPIRVTASPMRSGRSGATGPAPTSCSCLSIRHTTSGSRGIICCVR